MHFIPFGPARQFSHWYNSTPDKDSGPGDYTYIAPAGSEYLCKLYRSLTHTARCAVTQVWVAYLVGGGVVVALYLFVPPLKGSAPLENLVGLSALVALTAAGCGAER